MRVPMFIVGLVMTLLVASVAAQDAAAPDATRPLEAEKERLKEVRAGLAKQLTPIRDRLAGAEDVAGLRKAYEEAKAAHEAKKETDPDLAAAEKAEDQAKAAYKQAVAAAGAKDPGATQLKADLAAASKAVDVAEAECDDIDDAISSIKGKLAKADEVRNLSSEVSKLDRALKDLADKDATVATAKMARDDALKAYEAACEGLPEYEQRKENAEAYLAARHALPQYKARNDARSAYAAAAKVFLKGDAASAATAERDAAKKAYKQKIEDLLAADTEAAAHVAKRKAAEEAAKAADAKADEIEKKYEAAGEAAAAGDADAQKAKGAYDAARDAGRKVYAETTAATRKVREEARKAYDAKMKEKVEADPQGAEIAKQLKALEAQIQEVRDKIRQAEKA